MSSDLDKKITDLPPREKYKFFKKLDNILKNRYYSSVSGTIGKGYETLPLEELEKVKEKLYKGMFEKDKNKED